MNQSLKKKIIYICIIQIRGHFLEQMTPSSSAFLQQLTAPVIS